MTAENRNDISGMSAPEAYELGRSDERVVQAAALASRDAEVERLVKAINGLLMEWAMGVAEGAQIPHPNEPVFLELRAALAAVNKP